MNNRFFVIFDGTKHELSYTENIILEENRFIIEYHDSKIANKNCEFLKSLYYSLDNITFDLEHHDLLNNVAIIYKKCSISDMIMNYLTDGGVRFIIYFKEKEIQ